MRVRGLLVACWAIFVIGGLAVGYSALHTLSSLKPQTPPKADPVAAEAIATPPPLADRPLLRDFDNSPPPFAPAGAPDPSTADVPAPTPQPKSPVGRVTILLMGIDQRPDEAVAGGDPGRTDSMVLVSIDYDAHTASMVSIPRDGFIVIPRHGSERVNAAYTFGEMDHRGSGPQLAKQTVAQLFGVPVDRYALVDIRAMEQVIDTLGGVWIDNPRRLVDTQYPTDDYRTITIDIPAGRQLMDGVTAVEYARTRHADSDYGRQGRQQQVLLAIRDQALQLNVVPQLPQLLPQLLNLVRTDMSVLEIAQVANFGRELNRDRDIIALAPDPSLTPSYTGPGGASYINLTPNYRTAVKKLVEQPRIAAERAEIAVFNDGAPVGSGSRAADVLRGVGLLVSTVDTGALVTASRIEAGTGARHTAALVVQALGLPADALVLSGDSSTVHVLLGPDARVPSG
jgi:LCP family protein required for cell wall assembly